MHLDKAIGIGGDSLTLLGGIVLAFDALTRPARVHDNQAAAKVSDILRTKGAAQVDADGTPVETDALEAKDAARGRTLAIVGAAMVICGFAAQLASKLLGP